MANPREIKIAELKARIEAAKAEIAQLQADEQAEVAEAETGSAMNFKAAAGGNQSTGIGLDGNRNDQGDFVEAEFPPHREMNKDERRLYEAIMADDWDGTLTDELQLIANDMSDQDFIDTGIPVVNKKVFTIDDTLDNDEPPTGEKGSAMNLSGVKIEEKVEEVKPKLSDVTDAKPMNISGIDLSEDDEDGSIVDAIVTDPIHGVQPREEIDDIDKDERTDAESDKMRHGGVDAEEGRNKPEESNARGEKAGWSMAEGSNMWSVNEKDDYWKTQEGFNEAMDLYGKKPAWVKEPTLIWNPETQEYEEVEEEEFEDLSRPAVSADIKKLFG